MKRCISVFLIMFSFTAFSQKMLKGIVIDSVNKPIPFASIFLSNTSIGTKTDEEGKFQLWVPQGKFDLIISSVGYETFSSTIIATEQPDFNRYTLRIKTEELETVIIEPYEKDGWRKWGQFFLDNFIGSSKYTKECKIINQDVIRFRHSKSKNILVASASEPLIIENKALGYRIQYLIETFQSDFKNRMVTYTGFPFIESMKGSEGQKKKWEKNRKEAYYGSLMHFLRAVYINKINEEGFEVRALRRIPNLEKQRVKKILDSLMQGKNHLGNGTTSTHIDSSTYYNNILRQPDYTQYVEKNVLSGDSFAYAIDDKTAGLEFEDYLVILYTKKKAPFEYKSRPFQKEREPMQSIITILNNSQIEIQSNGSYYHPTDLLNLGYWAWSEKISMLLPYNYQPPKE